MNPAALRKNLKDLPAGGTLIVNSDAFSDRNLQKAGYTANPLEDGSLDEYRVHEVPLTSLTLEAVKGTGLTNREAERSKNMFALGLMSWLYTRPTEGTIEFIAKKFAKRPEIAEANTRAFNAGYAFGETSESFAVHYEVAPAPLPPGTYRNITGNQALALGLVAASVQSKLPLFLSAYPITPASDILHDLARHKNFGVRTFQAEDEIAAAGAALGASFGGALGVCTSSGPGVILKQETIGLAVTLELPLAHPRRPARGALDRNADEAGAGRPARGHVRAERGGAGAGRGRLDPRRLLPRGDRGGANRAQVPDARLRALGRVPRQRLRAVAAP